MTPERVYNLSGKLKYILTEDHLIEESTGGRGSWRRAWPLQQLSPELERVTSRPEGTKERLWGGAIALAVGLALYFSDFNAGAPLVAPLVLLLGLIVLSRGLRDLRMRTWTTIRKWDGSQVTWFLHDDCDHGERAAFSNAFGEAVKHIRRMGGADQ